MHELDAGVVCQSPCPSPRRALARKRTILGAAAVETAIGRHVVAGFRDRLEERAKHMTCRKPRDRRIQEPTHDVWIVRLPVAPHRGPATADPAPPAAPKALLLKNSQRTSYLDSCWSASVSICGTAASM